MIFIAILFLNSRSYLFIYYLEHPACKILARYTSDRTVVSALSFELVIELYLADLIKETVLSNYKQKEAVLGEIKEAVCHDYRKLKVFAEILCKHTATARIGYAIMRDYSKYMYYNTSN